MYKEWQHRVAQRPNRDLADDSIVPGAALHFLLLSHSLTFLLLPLAAGAKPAPTFFPRLTRAKGNEYTDAIEFPKANLTC